MMSTGCSVYSINLDLLRSHLESSESALGDLEKEFNETDSFIIGGQVPRLDIGHFGRVIGEWESFKGSLREFVDAWKEFDGYLAIIHQQLSEHGHSSDLTLRSYSLYGADREIILTTTADGKVSYDTLHDDIKKSLHLEDPDYFLSSVIGAPPELYDAATEAWLEDVKARTPIFMASFSASFEASGLVKFFDVDAGGSISCQKELFPNGKVRLMLSIDQSIGASLPAKLVDAGVGVEGGYMMAHEFENQEEANKFLASLKSNVFKVPPDVVGVAHVLSNDESLKELTAHVGVYADAGFEIPKWAEGGAGIHVGYARDFVSDKNIAYFNGNAHLGVEVEAGFASAEAAIAVDFEAEQHWLKNGDSHVELDLSFAISADVELDLLNKLLPDLDLGLEAGAAMGAEIAINAYLELDDPTAKQAWEDLMNPLDGSTMDMLAFLDRADITLMTSHIANTELIDIDLDAVIASVEIESDIETQRVTHVWAKPPGRGFVKVDV